MELHHQWFVQLHKTVQDLTHSADMHTSLSQTTLGRKVVCKLPMKLEVVTITDTVTDTDARPAVGHLF